jgi:protein-L-isoaspartate(D-aspartate) O-methyltransferase
MAKNKSEKVTEETLKENKNFLMHAWKKYGMVKNQAILDAFNIVHRSLFVLPEYYDATYEDIPLPILAQQTISQPSTVVLMLEALDVHEGQKILEIGAGSGYNAALLGVLVGSKGKVITTEIIPELFQFASENLKKAHISNVKVFNADGSKGYPEEAPYDRIIVTAGAPAIPETLIAQLKNNGILLIPTGNRYSQKLLRLKKADGNIFQEDLGEYRFVPLTGKYGVK